MRGVKTYRNVFSPRLERLSLSFGEMIPGLLVTGRLKEPLHLTHCHTDEGGLICFFLCGKIKRGYDTNQKMSRRRQRRRAKVKRKIKRKNTVTSQ